MPRKREKPRPTDPEWRGTHLTMPEVIYELHALGIDLAPSTIRRLAREGKIDKPVFAGLSRNQRHVAFYPRRVVQQIAAREKGVATERLRALNARYYFATSPEEQTEILAAVFSARGALIESFESFRQLMEAQIGRSLPAEQARIDELRGKPVDSNEIALAVQERQVPFFVKELVEAFPEIAPHWNHPSVGAAFAVLGLVQIAQRKVEHGDVAGGLRLLNTVALMANELRPYLARHNSHFKVAEEPMITPVPPVQIRTQEDRS